MVLPPLEAEKLVDGPQRFRIAGRYPNLSSTVQGPELVLDHPLLGGHDRRTRDRTGVHHARNREITGREGPGDAREVPPDGGYSGGVRSLLRRRDCAVEGECQVEREKNRGG